MKRIMLRVGIPAILLVVTCLPSIASAAGPAVFVNFGDIKGSSMDVNHKDWIDALAISEALAGPPPNVNARTGVATGVATYAPFQITKVLDKASVKLREAAAKGTHIPEVTVELTTPSDTSLVVLRIKLKEVLVSTVSMTAPAILGTSTSDTAPVAGAKEIVTIGASAVEWEFYTYKADGAVDSYIVAKWDFVNGHI